MEAGSTFTCSERPAAGPCPKEDLFPHPPCTASFNIILPPIMHLQCAFVPLMCSCETPQVFAFTSSPTRVLLSACLSISWKHLKKLRNASHPPPRRDSNPPASEWKAVALSRALPGYVNDASNIWGVWRKLIPFFVAKWSLSAILLLWNHCHIKLLRNSAAASLGNQPDTPRSIGNWSQPWSQAPSDEI